MVTIYIDSREASSAPQITEALKHRFPTSIQHLDVGDYYFPIEMCVERKTAANLYHDVMKKTFFEQLKRFIDNTPHPILLIEGDYTYYNISGVCWGVIISLLYSFPKLKLMFTDGYKGTIDFLRRLAVYTGPSGRIPPPSVVQKAQTPEEIRQYMLQCIKGIGNKVSRRILAEYEFGKLGTVPPQEMRRIAGVTMPISNLLNRVFNEKRKKLNIT